MVTKLEILRYEVSASWWACYCSSPITQKFASAYYLWKVNRKWRRFQQTLKMKELLESIHGDGNEY